MPFLSEAHEQAVPLKGASFMAFQRYDTAFQRKEQRLLEIGSHYPKEQLQNTGLEKHESEGFLGKET